MQIGSWLRRQRRRLAVALSDEDLLSRQAKLTARIEKRIDRLETAVEKLAASGLDREKSDRRIYGEILHSLRSLLKRHYLRDWPGLDIRSQLAIEEFRLESQNAEDGITLGLLRRIGVGHGTFVEVGSGMSGGNSACLALHLGWDGLMFERDAHKADVAAWRFRACDGVRVSCVEVSSTNVNQLLLDHGMRGEIEFFSLDIDSYDYWVWKAVDAISPKIVCLEYNAVFGASARVTVKDGALDSESPRYCHGASLGAMVALSRDKGYRLICCESSGVNSYFARNDLLPDLPEVTAEQAFRPLGKLSGDSVLIPRDLKSPDSYLELFGRYLVAV